MSRNNHSSILRDIPGCLLRSLLHYETTESTKIDIFLLAKRAHENGDDELLIPDVFEDEKFEDWTW